MVKKVTLVTRKLLPSMKKDAKYAQSASFRFAIQVPHLVLDHMLVPRFEPEYTGPEIFKKYLCRGWSENGSLRRAFDGASRMEVHLEPFVGPHGIRISILLFSADNPNQAFEVYTSMNDEGSGGIGCGTRTMKARENLEV